MTEALLNLPKEPVNFSLVPVDQLAVLFRSIVRDEIRTKQEEDLQGKLLSPKETCNLFSPKISLVTLDSWANKGLLTKYTLGGRTYYKYSEVMNSLQTLKKYSRK